MVDIKPLSASQVYRSCGLDQLQFETTAELEPLVEPFGQERLLKALRFGTTIENHGFNVFVLGPRDTDRSSFVRRFLKERASDRPVPSDWCYVFNFAKPGFPRALRLPAGHGRRLKSDVEHLVEELRGGVAAVFESEEYQSRMQDIQESLEKQQREGLSAIGKEAREADIALISTPGGFTLVPMRDGEVLEPAEFEKLDEAQRAEVEEKVAMLQKKLQAELQRVPALRKRFHQQVRQLNEEMVQLALGGPVAELKQRWQSEQPVVDWMDSASAHVVEMVASLHGRQEGAAQLAVLLERLEVNLLVDHSETVGAPVIYEDLPTHHRLVGRIEHQVRDGAVYADYSRIQAGALHEANGGYLILDAARVLSQPMAWESLKRALFSGDIQVETLDRLYGLATAGSLEPERVPLSVKVVLIGERHLYYLLAQHDPDFLELFKVEADFEDHVERSCDTLLLYARQLAALADRSGCPPLDRSAVSRMVEHASRLADDQRRLTAGDRVLRDILSEAGYWANDDGSSVVSSRHVQRALDERDERASRLQHAGLEQIERGIVMISTQGEAIAQVNGLSVMQLGDYSFGRPSRITATARPGGGQVVDVEREVKLGGSIHSKGVLILSRFIASRYAPESKLSLSASVVFEQSYGGVDGDSASLAETCVLLSAIARIPLRQSLAVTGSINQHGQVQAVGGVNEKIEGFFDVCRQAGELDGQGVLLPAANVEHLMVRPDVRDAVAAGKFFIYAVSTVDEALQLLSGMEVGVEQDGVFPPASFNGRVAERLANFARIAARRPEKNDEQHDENEAADEDR